MPSSYGGHSRVLRMSARQRKILVDNLVWFGASLMLAMIVWLTASFASDPVVQRPVRTVPIQVLIDDDTMIITNTPTNRASVILRARASEFELISPEDIQLTADLRDTETFGLVRVPIEGEIASTRRATLVDIAPEQINVEVQQREERFVPLSVTFVQEPPPSVAMDTPVFSEPQVRISGPADAVAQVEVARISLDLSDQRDTFEADVRPVPIDADGNPITNLTLDPDVVGVTIPISPRSDVTELRITPNLIGEPPEGFSLSGDLDYEPQFILVSGSPQALADLSGGVRTEPIDLSAYTEDFQIQVGVELTDDRLVVLSNSQVTVNVGIDPILSSRQFEAVPVEVIGLRDDLAAMVSPPTVTVIVNGPQTLLAELTVDDVQVIVDANSITATGTVQLEPLAAVSSGQFTVGDLSVIPAAVTIDVTTAPRATPLPTP